MCANCDQYDTNVSIRTPVELKRIVDKLRAAVGAGLLKCAEFESSHALVDQVRFERLDLDSALPDLIQYYFECPSCVATFGLLVETYHGSGGSWTRLGDSH